MHSTRRRFITTASQLAAASAMATSLPRQAQAGVLELTDTLPASNDPKLKEYVAKALDSARSAGASFADIRLVRARDRTSGIGGRGDAESLSVGVRVLVNGYWGFAASTIWSNDEMIRLGRSAVQIARAVARSNVMQQVELIPRPVVVDQHWTMPVGIDPFTISQDEIYDQMGGVTRYLRKFAASEGFVESISKKLQLKWALTFHRYDKVFGSSDGSYLSQRLYCIDGFMSIRLMQEGLPTVENIVESFTPKSTGWEGFFNEQLFGEIQDVFRWSIYEQENIPLAPIDPGRYAAVFDAKTTATMLSQTIGQATELDRVMGYEANASGTSYINDPASARGAFVVGNPLLHVTANRDEVGGAATVRYDDEGVMPIPFPMVEAGVISNFSMGRESATWLPRQAGAGVMVSNGCSNCGSESTLGGLNSASGGMHVPLVFTPNLQMRSGDITANVESFIGDMKKGVYIKNGRLDMDFQKLNGFILGKIFEVTNGKITGIMYAAGVLVRTPELWKNVTTLGDGKSAKRFGIPVLKGEPEQTHYHSTTAVPIRVKELSVIDATRRA